MNDTDTKTKAETIEIYGARGMKSTPFRKTFKNQAAFEKWLDKNEGDVTIHGTRRGE